MRRVVIDDKPAVSAGPTRKLESPGRRAAKRERAEEHRRRTVGEAQAAIETTLTERSEAWADGGRSPFLVFRQDGDQTPNKGDLAYEHREVPDSLKALHGEKRCARAEGRL